MRLPFPERIPLGPVFGFAGILCGVQLYQGTSAEFALCSFLFIVISALAFNVAGGFTRPSGGYIFFFSVLVVIVGMSWKAVMGEAGDSNLAVPRLTMLIYTGTAFSMLVAAFISRKLTLRRPLLADFVTDENMQSAVAGCTITGVLLAGILVAIPDKGSGTILSALQQLNQFSLVAVLLGTIHTIRRSGGKRCVSLPVLLSGGVIFILGGILSFSKQGMITPFLTWLVAACSQRYKLSVRQIITILLMTVFISQYLVPYSQYGRGFRQETLRENVAVSIDLLSNLGSVRTEFIESENETDEDMIFNYFSHHQGFLDRLQMIGPDDSLNQLTESGVMPGFYPVVIFFENFIPHFVWKNKPTWGGGNLYARQMGTISPEDESTGISFSPSGEAYHLLGWTGILLLLPILLIMYFALFDSLCGDTQRWPWGLIALISFAHIAPEGGVGVMVGTTPYLAAGIIFAAVTSSYLMPIIGELIIGPNKKKTVFFANRGRSQPASLNAVNPSGGV